MLVLSFQVAAMLMEMVFGTEVQWQLSLLVFDFQAFYFIIRIVFVDISIINSNYYFLFHMVVEMALYRVLDLWFTSSYILSSFSHLRYIWNKQPAWSFILFSYRKCSWDVSTYWHLSLCSFSNLVYQSVTFVSYTWYIEKVETSLDYWTCK